MKLEKVITLANWRVRLQFKAMERSLRATGCDLASWALIPRGGGTPLRSRGRSNLAAIKYSSHSIDHHTRSPSHE